MLSLKEARERRQNVGFKPSDLDKPAFLGLRQIQVPLEELIPFIDWRPFFSAWGLQGDLSIIFHDPTHGETAKESYDNAKALLDRIVHEKSLQARGVYGFWPALSIGDDIVLYRAESLREEVARFPMLRQQSDRGAGEYTMSLADFIAPKQSGLTDYIGAFAVTAGLGAEDLAKRYERGSDRHNAIIVKALADRLADAFAVYLHARARKDFGHGYQEKLSDQDIKDNNHRGIRPAFGDPACPDHTDKRTLFALLGAREIGMDLTEQLAMTPVASLSGLYFAHPKARYFSVGLLAKDQIEDYAARRGTNAREVERWLQPNLAYDPE